MLGSFKLLMGGHSDPKMAKNRIRIDGHSSDGTSYNLTLEGRLTRDKVLRVFEMMNLMDMEDGREELDMDSTGSKIWHIVDKFFPTGKFTSSNVLEKFEDEFNEPVKLSVISTYLSRYSSKGRVDRTKTGREWTYHTIPVPQGRP